MSFPIVFCGFSYWSEPLKLPNGNRAIVEIDKLRNYCLDPRHPRGRHKARVFSATLGLSAAEADVLRDALVGAAAVQDAEPGQTDLYGTRYTFNVQVEHGARTALVRCHWIVRRNEDVPRLVTCYVA